MAGSVAAQTNRVDGLTVVRAAGGVLWREGLAGTIEIALVHRPRYDDWSLPKGKLKHGEHPLAAACREVLEETGIRPRPGPRLPTASYKVRIGEEMVDKTVDYWAMTVLDDPGFNPGTETDGMVWLTVAEALDRLSYPHDVEVVRGFADLPVITGIAVLVRHTEAGTSGSWPGPDAARPLDEAGRAHAQKLAGVLRWFSPARLVSAPPRRCAQTLAPLAAQLDLPIDLDAAFEESADPAMAARRLRLHVPDKGATIVCSQGGLIPQVLAELTGSPDTAFRTPKGAAWVISFSGESVAAVDRLP